MNKITNIIIQLFSIEISSKHISEALSQKQNIIVLHRHKLFLLKTILLQWIGCILVGTYFIMVISIIASPFIYIMNTILLIIFLLRLIISFRVYNKHLKERKTIYVGNEWKALIDKKFFNSYLANAILLWCLLIIDVCMTIIFQIVVEWTSIRMLFIYAIEILICVFLIWIIMKTVKYQLDFEMDQVIFTQWWIKLIDREWLYTIQSKTYLWNQIQTIEIIQSWRLDAFFKIWTLRVQTWNALEWEQSQILSFWKIDYSDVIETKLRAVIYEK
jgi:hypothetical protein